MVSTKLANMNGGFSYFDTSITAPIASGRSDLAGWEHAPTRKAPPYHGAHPNQSVEFIGTNCSQTADKISGFHCDRNNALQSCSIKSIDKSMKYGKHYTLSPRACDKLLLVY